MTILIRTLGMTLILIVALAATDHFVCPQIAVMSERESTVTESQNRSLVSHERRERHLLETSMMLAYGPGGYVQD